ncbi:hypothetical protein CIL05_14025 [Virgibacillus profundi]|uniref:C2H2-type domain-containing protein n=1 Tax=Virgibacillus profundi TaxID=2024555 RepID=A0A2A2IBU2_9BACI|nr:hypothetical protein [Virgibacillus profundi]PAV29087.1 hypothetical protein CIL05_14025 [Virgibacillus profundi]PXY53256.1 hypothetical protein CIT14_14150 [Virgibacillus profundi]
MKSYNAKNPQECKICGYKLSHNKQGRFTQHLKEHNFTLDSYLSKYYYSYQDLKCNRDSCNNMVSLTRGIPNKFCSSSCRQKKPPLICAECGSDFEAKNRNTKTCSSVCAKKIKSKKITLWHKGMHPDEKQKHFKRIITKTAATRRNNNTPSWNSGKKGIYSETTINKIRQATLKQMKEKVFRKTNIEIIIEKFLMKNKINYRYSYILENRQFVFLLIDYKIIIECDGDYWHANPKFYPFPKEWQEERIKIDLIKNGIAITNGYKIIRFWEDDILNNLQYVERIIYDLLATT